MTFLEVIESAPRILKQIVNDNVAEISEKLEQEFGNHQFQSVVVIASGSSYNAALVVKRYCESLGIKMDIYYPNMFLHYINMEVIDKDALFVFVSQGGGTKDVYYCVEKVKEFNGQNILITEYTDGPIASVSQVVVEMGSEKEPYIFRTIGFDATCATLSVIVSELFGGNYLELKDSINLIAENLPNVIELADQFYQANKSELLKADVMVFIGTNDLWPISQEAAIKFMEMLPVYTVAYELEESIHGPQNAFNEQAAYFMNYREHESFEKVKSIHSFIKNEVSRNIYLVGDTDYENSVNLKTTDSQFNYLEYITFYQVVAYLVATDKGRDLSKVMYPQLTNYIAKKFEDEK